MANSFYNNAWTGVANAVATKASMNTEYDLVVTGFNTADSTIQDNSVRVLSPDTIVALGAAATRVGKVLTFDSNGAPSVDSLIDGTLFDESATNLMPVTFTSDARNVSGSTYVPWDNGPVPDIGSSYTIGSPGWTTAPGSMIIPAKSGLYLMQYSVDVTPASAVTNGTMDVSFQSIIEFSSGLGIAMDDIPLESHILVTADNHFVSGETHNWNVMCPIWYNVDPGTQPTGLFVQIVLSGASSGFNLTNERLTLLRLAPSSGEI